MYILMPAQLAAEFFYVLPLWAVTHQQQFGVYVIADFAEHVNYIIHSFHLAEVRSVHDDFLAIAGNHLAEVLLVQFLEA